MGPQARSCPESRSWSSKDRLIVRHSEFFTAYQPISPTIDNEMPVHFRTFEIVLGRSYAVWNSQLSCSFSFINWSNSALSVPVSEPRCMLGGRFNMKLKLL